jgi:hypothetical protein
VAPPSRISAGNPDFVDVPSRLFTTWEMHRILIIPLKAWKRLHPYLT